VLGGRGTARASGGRPRLVRERARLPRGIDRSPIAGAARRFSIGTVTAEDVFQLTGAVLARLSG
jgi:hypothetical protein